MEKKVESEEALVKMIPEKNIVKKKNGLSKLQNIFICVIIVIFMILIMLAAFVIINHIQINKLNEQINSCTNAKVDNEEHRYGNVLKIDKNHKQESIKWSFTKSPGIAKRSIIEDPDTTYDPFVSPQNNEMTTKAAFVEAVGQTRKPDKIRKDRKKNKKRGDKKKKSKKARKQKVAVHLISNIGQDTWTLAMKMSENKRHHFPHGYIQDQAYSPFDVTYAFWALDDWCKQNTLVDLSNNTTLTVKESGTYYVYVHIMHRDDKRMWAAAIFIDNKRFIQCVGSKSFLEDSGAASHQCNVAGTTYIERGQRLHVGSLYRSPELVLLPSATFWGLIKLD